MNNEIDNSNLLSQMSAPYEVLILTSTDSTNNELKRRAAVGAPHGTALIAREQTAGKGRMGRSFFSPKSGLYLSLLLRPHSDPADSLFFTTATGVAVCRAIEKTTDLKAQIKWVNDVYIGEKKVCGILAESSISQGVTEWTVIGLGINVTPPDGGFPEEIADRACALFPQTAPQGFVDTLAAAVLDELYYVFGSDRDATAKEYCMRSMVVGRTVIADNGGAQRKCKVLGVTDSAALIVEYEDGSRGRLISGEVRIFL